jgi:hypothetical protein
VLRLEQGRSNIFLLRNKEMLVHDFRERQWNSRPLPPKCRAEATK